MTQENKEEIKKGLYDVSRISQILQDLNWLQQSIEAEAEWENDKSKIPDDLKQVVASLAQILIETVKEETDELIQNKPDLDEEILTSNDQDDTIEMSLKNGEMSKSIKKDELNFEEMLKSINSKIDSKNDEIEEIKKSLNKKDETIESLSKRIKTFEDMPQPFKHELVNLSKQNDTSMNKSQDDQYNVMINGKIDPVASAIKKARATRTA